MFVVLLLVMGGVVMVFSASAILSSEKFSSPYYFLYRQIIWSFLGILIMSVLSRIHYKKIRGLSRIFLLLSVLLLIAVLIPGIRRSYHSASRWIQFGPFSLQPSEFVKVFLIVYLAEMVERKNSRLKELKVFLPVIFTAVVISYLIYLEPDFGNALIIGVIFCIFLFIGKARLKHLAAVLILAVPLICLTLFSAEYRKLRIFSFLNPWANANSNASSPTNII